MKTLIQNANLIDGLAAESAAGMNLLIEDGVISAIGPAVAPMDLSERLGARFPAAAPPAASLVRLYLRESFGEERLGAEELQRARGLLKEVLGTLRRRGR